MLERTLTRRIKSLQKDFKIIFISGSRQVGKTTILKTLKEDERSYVTLDNQVDMELAQSDPNSFFLLHILFSFSILFLALLMKFSGQRSFLYQ